VFLRRSWHTVRAAERWGLPSAYNYTYDDEGRLQAAGSASFTFDCDQRLIGIDTGTQFFYDGRGNRLKAIRGGVTTFYIYDPWGNLLAEADANGITRKYVYGNGLLALATSSDLYCYHFDATGNTIALTDMAQTVVNSYAYEPFGQVLAQQESVAQPFKFVGRYGVMAEPSGIYYMRARYYDPSVGRFISEDPLGFGGGDVNLYAYVGSVEKPFIETNLYDYTDNDPINRIDPLGLQSVKPGVALPLPPVFFPGTLENKAFTKSILQMTNTIGSIWDDIIGNSKGSTIGKYPDCEDGGRCKKVNDICIEECSGSSLPSGDHRFRFWNCVNTCMEDNGC